MQKNRLIFSHHVIPAHAGIQDQGQNKLIAWDHVIPAHA